MPALALEFVPLDEDATGEVISYSDVYDENGAGDEGKNALAVFTQKTPFDIMNSSNRLCFDSAERSGK